MSQAVHTPTMSRDEFLGWAEVQPARYEFDGLEAVLMTGGLLGHSVICQNLWAALRSGLRNGGCRSLGPDAGVATVGEAVRYPDALITCADIDPKAKLTPGVVVVFEVLSPTSGRIDRIDKVREYASVSTILRYVVLEYSSRALTSYERPSGGQPWTVTPLVAGDVLRLPEVGIELPVAECYEGLELEDPS